MDNRQHKQQQSEQARKDNRKQFNQKAQEEKKSGPQLQIYQAPYGAYQQSQINPTAQPFQQNPHQQPLQGYPTQVQQQYPPLRQPHSLDMYQFQRPSQQQSYQQSPYHGQSQSSQSQFQTNPGYNPQSFESQFSQLNIETSQVRPQSQFGQSYGSRPINQSVFNPYQPTQRPPGSAQPNAALQNVSFLWNSPEQEQFLQGQTPFESRVQSHESYNRPPASSDISGFTPVGSSLTSISNLDQMGPGRSTVGATPDFSLGRFDIVEGSRQPLIQSPSMKLAKSTSHSTGKSGTIGSRLTDSASSISGTASSLSSATTGQQLIRAPQRPGFGIKGRKIMTKVNFFELITIPGQDIWQYEYKVEPDLPPSLNRKIFQQVAKHLKIRIDQLKVVNSTYSAVSNLIFDGKSTVYSPAQLQLKDLAQLLNAEIINETQINFFIHVKDHDPIRLESVIFNDQNLSEQDKALRKISISFREILKIDPISLQKFINGTHNVNAEHANDILKTLDVLMRYRPSMLHTSIGKSYFSRRDVKTLGDGSECWMGYHQSLVPTRDKVLLNIDISATAFYEPAPLINFIAKSFGKRSVDDFNSKSSLKAREVEKLEKLIKGVKIQVNHRGEIKRKYRISGVTKTSADLTFFKQLVQQDSETVEKEMSVKDYFLTQYNLSLKYPNLPCVKVGTQERNIYLPLEVCEIVAGQRYLKKLNEQQTAQMIKLTCQAPERRANKIQSSLVDIGLQNKPQAQPNVNDKGTLNSEDSKYLAQFGIKLSNEMMSVPARVLNPPTLQYHPSSKESLITPRDGSWNLRDKKVVQPATLHSWGIVCFGSPKEMPQQKIDGFLRELISTCNDTGLHITNQHPPALYADPNGNIEEALSSVWNAAGESVQAYPQLILCILPNSGVQLYAEIKRVGDTVLGVPTQCVLVKHTYQAKKQYCANVCLKINAKLGGVNNFIVRNPQIQGDEGLPWVSDIPTMIIGADITHPAHGENKSGGSVAALVGSLDRLASRYSATVRVQTARKEIIQDLSSMMQDLLKAFHMENSNILPQRLLFYRDGISDTQAHAAALKEIEFIRDACEKISPGYKPKITFVAVQKRHHARVFASNPRDADKSGNVPAGTVIDSHITHPNEYDFYLCSHAGLQGTSRPTHYHVLHDENQFTPDLLQEVTYRLCYGYARCTRSVSVVPPVYYADLVAFRAKYHMRGQTGSAQSVQPSGTGGSLYSDPKDSIRSSSPGRAFTEGAFIEGNETDKQSISSLKKQTDEAELLRQLKERMVPVKPELQKVMYFM